MRLFRPTRRTSQGSARPSSRALIALAAALSLVTFIGCAERSALWHVVHDLYVVDQLHNGGPAPCDYVNLADGERNGYAILKDCAARHSTCSLPRDDLRHREPGPSRRRCT